eukprot:1028430-Amphidinium_carterae.1
MRNHFCRDCNVVFALLANTVRLSSCWGGFLLKIANGNEAIGNLLNFDLLIGVVAGCLAAEVQLQRSSRDCRRHYTRFCIILGVRVPG